jgi:hypothetical protein
MVIVPRQVLTYQLLALLGEQYFEHTLVHCPLRFRILWMVVGLKAKCTLSMIWLISFGVSDPPDALSWPRHLLTGDEYAPAMPAGFIAWVHQLPHVQNVPSCQVMRHGTMNMLQLILGGVATQLNVSSQGCISCMLRQSEILYVLSV